MVAQIQQSARQQYFVCAQLHNMHHVKQISFDIEAGMILWIGKHPHTQCSGLISHDAKLGCTIWFGGHVLKRSLGNRKFHVAQLIVLNKLM
jgi:hypothetical protein